MTDGAGQRWDGLDAERVGTEPWWELLAPGSDPGLPDRLAALDARAGYRLDPSCYVAADAHVVASRCSIGPRSYVASGCRLRDELTVGSDCSLNPGVVTIGRVTIGDGVRIAAYVALVGECHVFDDPDVPIHEQGVTSAGIVIGDDVWIGANATVLDGVTIGSHSVVGAGAVVTRSVPPHSVVVGVPARVLRSRLDPTGDRAASLGSERSRGGDRDRMERFSDAVAEQWPEVIERCRVTVDGRTAWSEVPGGDPLEPRPRNDAVEIAGMFGSLPPGTTRGDLVEQIQDLQDPDTGLFPDPRVGPPAEPLRFCLEEWEMYGIESCGHALEVLGSGPRHPVHVVERCGHDELHARLEQLDRGAFGVPGSTATAPPCTSTAPTTDRPTPRRCCGGGSPPARTRPAACGAPTCPTTATGSGPG